MKDVDLEEPTSFLDHVYLGCTQRVSNQQGYRGWLQRYVRIKDSAGATEKLPETKATRKPDTETIYSWSYDMEGHAQKCGERLRTWQLNNCRKVATPCMNDHQFKEEEDESVGIFSTVCSQIVLECLYLARIGRPDILRSVNMDNSLWQTFSTLDLLHFITHVNTGNVVMWETLHNIAD